VLRGHNRIVSHAAFSPNGELVVTASEDKTGQLWEGGTGQNLLVLRGHRSNVNSVAFSPDGKFIVTAGQDKIARIYRCEECVSLAELHHLADQRLALTGAEKFLTQISNQ
jgi:WD40 repeat protein